MFDRREPRTFLSPLLGVVSVATCATLPMFMVGALGEQVRADLQIGLAQFGLLSATYYSAGVVFAVAAGWVAEILGSATTMRMAVVLDVALLLALASVADSLVTLAVVLGAAGLANALAQPSTNLHLAVNVAHSVQGRAFGLKQASVPAASMLGGIAVPAVGLTVGWRWAFVMAAGLAVLALASVRGENARLARQRGRRPESSTGTLGALALGAGLCSSAAVTLGIFLVGGAVRVGIDEAVAGIVLAVASAASISARVISGRLADARGGSHFGVVARMMLVGAIGMGLLATELPALYVAGAITAFCFGWGWPAIYVLSVVQLNPSAPGLASSMTQAGAALGSVIGPIAFGQIADRLGFRPAWLAAGTAMACGGLILWRVDHHLRPSASLQPVSVACRRV